MILGAGRGTRLGAASRTVPKILVDIAGQPLLQRQVVYLHAQGTRRVVVNSNHRAEKVEAFVHAYDGPVEVVEVREPALLGTAGGVRHALDQLGDQPFVVLYGDVLVGESLGALFAAHAANGAQATITVYESAELLGKRTVQVREDGRVYGFTEKAAPAGADEMGLINAGIYVIDPEFVADLPLGTELDFGCDVFPSAIEHQASIAAVRLAAPVIDVGTPAGLERAHALLASGRSEWPTRAHGDADGNPGSPASPGAS